MAGYRMMGAAMGAETMLIEAVRRAGRQPHGRIALVLHLSRLAAPRPHHRRIAKAMLQDTAQRHEGQVFALRNGDLVLLCRGASGGPLPPMSGAAAELATPDPQSLPQTFARLLRLDAADPESMISLWPLDHASDDMMSYAQARLAEPPPETDPLAAPSTETRSEPVTFDTIGNLVATGSIQDLMQRQTAILLHGSTVAARLGREPAGQALRPLYREVTFSIAALEARIRAGGLASADPFLFRHLAGRLDVRMLNVLRGELGTGSPLDLKPATGIATPPLHLNLTVEGVLSESFAALAASCRAANARLGVEISLIEACADGPRFVAARDVIRAAGMELILDGVSHLALLLAVPGQFRADLLKLDWSPRLPDLRTDEATALRTAIAAIGVQRIVLQRAETEAAIRWGLMHGIRRFQGRHVDAMLAASRIMGCPLSRGCTLRQCIERARATGPAGRSGCGNPVLLDVGAPTPAVSLEPVPPLPTLPIPVAGDPITVGEIAVGATAVCAEALMPVAAA